MTRAADFQASPDGERRRRASVRIEKAGPVWTVLLHRPEKRNAMNQELLVALREALREAADDASVHCVLLRGEGPVFSAGVDLGELASFAGDSTVLRPFRTVFLECANLCESMTKPVVSVAATVESLVRQSALRRTSFESSVRALTSWTLMK